MFLNVLETLNVLHVYCEYKRTYLPLLYHTYLTLWLNPLEVIVIVCCANDDLLTTCVLAAVSIKGVDTMKAVLLVQYWFTAAEPFEKRT